MAHISRNRKPEALMNEKIRAREVRLISPTGEQLGIMSTSDALDNAIRQDLDLVMISPGAKPPVCKIMDYGKFKYEQAKKEKEARKKQKSFEVKGIRLSLNIEDNDLNTKANRAKKFLGDGDKVRVELRFRGRELGHTRLGYGVMDKFFAELEEIGNIEQKAKMEGRNMTMVISPKN